MNWGLCRRYGEVFAFGKSEVVRSTVKFVLSTSEVDFAVDNPSVTSCQLPLHKGAFVIRSKTSELRQSAGSGLFRAGEGIL